MSSEESKKVKKNLPVAHLEQSFPSFPKPFLRASEFDLLDEAPCHLEFLSYTTRLSFREEQVALGRGKSSIRM